MKTRTNVELYERILETFNREGLDGVVPFFADDIEVYDPDMPQGSYRGRQAVRRMIQLLTSGFSKVEVRASRLVPAGDRVVALLHTRATGERDGLVLEAVHAHTITFRDGKISYWRLYLDQAEALSDAGLDPELAMTAKG